MRRNLSPVVVAAAAGLALGVGAQAARAQQSFYEWVGGLDQNWSNAGNWDPTGVPNTAGEVALFLGGKTCNLDITVTVDKLGNFYGDTLNMLNDRDITVIGDPDPNGHGGDGPTGIFSIYGTVNMLAAANPTDLTVKNGTLTIGNADDAPCSLNMSNSPNNRIFGGTGAVAIQFDSSLHITGAGQIGVNTCQINNWGAIVANQPTTLTLDPGAAGFFNFGELSAQNGATLVLNPGTLENSGGLIAARDGSVVLLNGCTIQGAGFIQTFGSGVLRVNTIGAATRIESQTINGVIEMPNDKDLLITGSLSIAPAINMLATANPTDLYLDGPVSFDGGGTINMSNSANNRILYQSGGQAGDGLTNNSCTIRGSGQIGLNSIDIVNHANIVADQATTLDIDPATSLINTGLLVAQSGGTLRLEPGLYDSTAGLIAANDASVVQLAGCRVTGQLGGSGTGYFDVTTIGGATVLDHVAMNRRLRLANDRDVVIIGAFNQAANIDMLAAANPTDIYLDGPVTLTGGGTIDMSNSPNNRILSLNGGLSGDALTNQDFLIHGAGQIGLNSIDITNLAEIRADQPGGTLYLDPATTLDNQGTLEASAGGILQFEAGDYANVGVIHVADQSHANLNGCTVDGALFTEGTGYFTVLTIGSATLLHDAQITGRLVQPNDRDLLVRGTIDHAGDWDLQATANGTDIYCDGPVVLTGGGTMNLSASPNNRILFLSGGMSGDALRIDDYTIHGAGQLGLNSMDIENHGLLLSDAPGQTLYLDPATAITNLGEIAAAEGGVLRLESGIHDHTAGLLHIGDGSRAELNSCTLTGRVLTEGSGLLDVVTIGSATQIHDAEITGRLRMSNDRDLLVRGVLDLDGRWDMLATANATDVYVDGPVTISGPGIIQLSDSLNNRFLFLSGGLGGDELTLDGPGIHGAGQIGLNSMDIVNRGSLVADAAANRLILDPASTLTNEGLLHAATAPGMRLENAAYTSSGRRPGRCRLTPRAGRRFLHPDRRRLRRQRRVPERYQPADFHRRHCRRLRPDRFQREQHRRHGQPRQFARHTLHRGRVHAGRRGHARVRDAEHHHPRPARRHGPRLAPRHRPRDRPPGLHTQARRQLPDPHRRRRHRGLRHHPGRRLPRRTHRRARLSRHRRHPRRQHRLRRRLERGQRREYPGCHRLSQRLERQGPGRRPQRGRRRQHPGRPRVPERVVRRLLGREAPNPGTGAGEGSGVWGNAGPVSRADSALGPAGVNPYARVRSPSSKDPSCAAGRRPSLSCTSPRPPPSHRPRRWRPRRSSRGPTSRT
ncbi:MAG: hypothetical protein IPJ41_02420 [Phycisphaerales bacterium]|nr:hypothetical protein [Phycisphaerales bacterium]